MTSRAASFFSGREPGIFYLEHSSLLLIASLLYSFSFSIDQCSLLPSLYDETCPHRIPKPTFRVQYYGKRVCLCLSSNSVLGGSIQLQIWAQSRAFQWNMVARNSSKRRGRQLQGRGTEQKSQRLQPSIYSDSKGYNFFPRHPQL